MLAAVPCPGFHPGADCRPVLVMQWFADAELGVQQNKNGAVRRQHYISMPAKTFYRKKDPLADMTDAEVFE